MIRSVIERKSAMFVSTCWDKGNAAADSLTRAVWHTTRRPALCAANENLMGKHLLNEQESTRNGGNAHCID